MLANRISLCTCEQAAENSAFGSGFRQLFHHTPTRASGRFNLFLGSGAPTVAHILDIHSHAPSPPPVLRETYFGSTNSVPKIDSSPSTLRVVARGKYRTVLPTAIRRCLPLHRRPFSSGVYSLFRRTYASSHERTTIAGPPALFWCLERFGARKDLMLGKFSCQHQHQHQSGSH
jgi:hypothetical protein